MAGLGNEYATKGEEYFDCRNIFYSGRKTISHVLIIPKCFEGESLQEQFESAKGDMVYYYVDYNGDLGSLLRCREFTNDYNVYSFTINAPPNDEALIQNNWLCTTLMVPFIASVMNLECRSVKIRTLCPVKHLCLVGELFNFKWLQVKDKVLRQLKIIIGNPTAWVCLSCTESCDYLYHTWHLNLDKFVKQVPQPNIETSFDIDGLSLFDGNDISLLSLMKSIRRAYFLHSNTNSNVGLPTISEILLTNAMAQALRKHYTYLVALIDGSTMNNYLGKTPRELLLLKDPELLVILYMGSTVEGPFRATHCKSSSPIRQVYSQTTVMCMLRSMTFKYSGDSKIDEALALEILKYDLSVRHYHTPRKPYILLNKFSAQSKLAGVSDTLQKQATDFKNSDIPVLLRNERDLDEGNVPESFFTGLYTSDDRFHLGVPHAKLSTFQQVKHLWIQMDKYCHV